MFNYILLTYIISTVVIWVVFWSRINGMESELNTYYYIPEFKDSKIKLYVKCDGLSILLLFVPIVNFIFIIRTMLEDHLELLGEFADEIGAIPLILKDYKDNNNNT